MGFRVSTSAAFMFFRRNIGLANERQARIAEQMATGKRVNLPSDDPLAAQSIAAFREANQRVAMYQRNVTMADHRWKMIESDMGSANEVLVRAKELAIQGNNGTLSAEQRRLIAQEVSQLSKQFLAISNRNIDGEYIYGGYHTNALPFAHDGSFPDANPAVTYAGDSNVKQVQIGENEWIDIQVSGGRVFKGTGITGGVDPSQVLANLEQALLTNNVDDSDPASVGQALDDVNKAIEQMTGEIANTGAVANRLEGLRMSLQTQSDLNTEFLSQNEDIDLAEAAYEFQRAQIVLQATVQSASAILNRPSLMDFIGR